LPRAFKKYCVKNLTAYPCVVFYGMIGVTFFGLFLTPVFFTIIRKLLGDKPILARKIHPPQTSVLNRVPNRIAFGSFIPKMQNTSPPTIQKTDTMLFMSSPLYPLPYASPNPSHQPTRYAVFAILSLLIGIVSFLGHGVATFDRGINLFHYRDEIAYSKTAIRNAPINAAAVAAGEHSAAKLPPPPGLTPAQISLVLNYLPNQCQIPLTSAQLGTLTTQLSQTGQQIIDPQISLPSFGSYDNKDTVQDLTMQVLSNGDAVIKTDHGVNFMINPTRCTIIIDPQGIIKRLEVSSRKGILISTPGGTIQKTAYNLPYNATPSYLASLQSAFHTDIFITAMLALDAALAMLLIVAAMALFRNNARGIRMHRLYAYAKIPVEITIAASLLSSRFPLRYYHPVLFSTTILPVTALCTIGCVYPIILLLMLRLPPRPSIDQSTQSGR
jgi:hypothetical protein